MNEEPKKTSNRVLQFTLALFVVLPSVLFWLFLGLVGIGILLVADDEEETCNVARVPIKGILATTDTGIAQLLGLGAIVSADSLVEQLTKAEENEDVVAIVLDIDSPGGTPVAADEIMKALLALTKPNVSVIRDNGASAAYWVAAGTDRIIASPISDVGSIGVTMSYTEFASSSESEGARWIDLSSGPFKDAGNPERTLKGEEEEYFQEQVDVIYEYMLDQISNARTVLSREGLKDLADGRAFLGAKALEHKLIDELGSFDEARSYIAERLGMEKDAVVLCPVPSTGLGDLLK